MKRDLRTAVVPVAITLATFGLGCGGDAKGDKQLHQMAQRAVSQNRPLDLGKLETRNWDRLHVFGAYTPPNAITRELGFAWKDAKERSPSQDATFLYVFVEGSRVVSSFQSGAVNARCLTGHPLARRDPAVIVKSVEGADVIVAAPGGGCSRL